MNFRRKHSGSVSGITQVDLTGGVPGLVDETEELPSSSSKKPRNLKYAFKDSSRTERVIKKIVSDVNSVLAMTSFEGKIDSSHVQFSVLESGLLSASVQCLLCKAPKKIVLGGTNYTIESQNYKRHVALVHIEKGSELKAGSKTKIKQGQRSVMSFLQTNKAAAAAASPAETPETVEEIESDHDDIAPSN